VVEFSTNGLDWDPIQTFFSFSQTGWDQHSLEIPLAAQSATTQFRWRQLANSGNDQDNWTLDNIAISFVSNTGLTFDWTNEDGNVALDESSPEVFPSQSTTYYVEAIDPDTGCNYLDSVYINVGQNFALDITSDTVLCDTQGIELEAIPSTNDSFTYLWSPDDGSVSSIFSNSPIVTPNSTTTYSVEVSSDQGCVNTAEVTVSVNQLLDLNVTVSDTEICFGEPVNLSANVSGNPPGIVYEWTSADDLDDHLIANPVAIPSESTTYIVTATDTETMCSLTDDITVNVSGAFSIDAGEDQLVCDAVGLELTATPNVFGAYTWVWEPALEVNNVNSPVTNVVNNITNEFVISATEGDCTQTDTVLIEVLFENFNLGPDLEICSGDSVILSTGFPDSNQEWSTSETTESITIFDEAFYDVTITSDLGCEISDEIYVTVHDLPVVNLGEDQELCVGEDLNLDAQNSGDDFLWSTSEVTQVINITTSDMYSVEVTDANNCVSNDEINVIFYDNPSLSLPEDTTICEDAFITLSAGNDGSDYLWSPNAESSQSITVNTAANYSVQITNPEGCTTFDEIELEVAVYPTLDLGPDISACEGESEMLETQASADLNVY